MRVFTSNGCRTIPDEHIRFAFHDRMVGRWCSVTVVLDGGKEVTGLALSAAVAALRRSPAMMPRSSAQRAADYRSRRVCGLNSVLLDVDRQVVLASGLTSRSKSPRRKRGERY